MKLPPKAQTPRELAIRMLERTDVIISDGRWTKGASARNKYGCPISALASGACRWCLRFALMKAQDEAKRRYERTFVANANRIAITVLRKQSGGIIHFNDSPRRTVEEVHEMLDKAIASLKEAASQATLLAD